MICPSYFTFGWIHEENKGGNIQDEREIPDPLWMLNHLHIADIKRNGKRPMFFSRYSGPGSQRYPVGFSGDTLVTWESLDFQPYFTATSSNVGYSWWSHDIVGHMSGYRDDDLITRWMQLGVFSPINRLHSCNTNFIRKEPWFFEEKTKNIMKNWLRLRHQLFPYIYTMNYRNHVDLEPLVQPIYYAYPKKSAAYEVKNQFMVGSQLMVAPITKPNSKITQMGSVNAWLPAGDWFDFFTGLHYTSKAGRTLSVHRKINDYPVFTLKPANGALSLLPKTRNYSFVLRGYNANISVKVLVDGYEIACECAYDPDTHSVVIKLSADVTSEIQLMINGDELITERSLSISFLNISS